MSLLIKNGEMVTAEDRRIVDILCEGEKIAHIRENITAPPGTPVIDARGQYVFPGFIDPHAHVHLPLKDTCAKDTYETAGRAALIGGTTCLIDFISPARDQEPLRALEIWEEKSRGHSACDYTFHLAVTRFDRTTEKQIREIVDRGISSFKVYLAYKDTVHLPDDELFGLMQSARELGVVVLGHCENAMAIDALQRQLLAEGKTGPEWHYFSRPPAIEAQGTHHFLTFAERTGARAYVVHLSCREALQQAVAARERGVNVRIETLPSYLLLDKTCAERPGFEGAKYVVSPPLREQDNQPALWDALKNKVIDTVGSDHAPFDFATQKRLGEKDFTRIPNGMPTLEDRVNLLFTRGVVEGRIDIRRFVEVASTNPAKIFGLHPRKGTLQPGSDADLVVYNPGYSGIISAKTHSMNVDYNPYEGFTIKGRPEFVTVRGEVVVRHGQFVGRTDRGNFIAREAG